MIEFFWGLIQLSLFVGMVGYGYVDYRRGWPTARAIGEKAVDIYDGLGFGSQSGVRRARRIVRQHAKQLGMLQQAVARVATNVERARGKEVAQLKLAADYRTLQDEALMREAQNPDQAHASIAMSTALTTTTQFLPSVVFANGEGSEAQKVLVLAARAAAEVELRATMYRKTAERQEVVLRKLQDKLGNVEVAYEALRTEAETIEVSADSAAADRALYSLLSEVSATTGLTPKGELAELKEDTERAAIEAAKLVEMTQRSNILDTVMKGMQISKVVAAEIEAAQKRVSGLLSSVSHIVKIVKNGDHEEDDSLVVTDADYRVADSDSTAKDTGH